MDKCATLISIQKATELKVRAVSSSRWQVENQGQGQSTHSLPKWTLAPEGSAGTRRVSTGNSSSHRFTPDAPSASRASQDLRSRRRRCPGAPCLSKGFAGSAQFSSYLSGVNLGQPWDWDMSKMAVFQTDTQTPVFLVKQKQVNSHTKTMKKTTSDPRISDSPPSVSAL